MPPKATTSPDQFEFDGLFVFSQGKQNLTIAEVCEALGMSTVQVRKHVDLGNFVAYPIGDQAAAQREHLRLTRYSVVAWWREEQLKRQQAEPPFYQSVQVLWWREQLRKRLTK